MIEAMMVPSPKVDNKAMPFDSLQKAPVEPIVLHGDSTRHLAYGDDLGDGHRTVLRKRCIIVVALMAVLFVSSALFTVLLYGVLRPTASLLPAPTLPKLGPRARQPAEACVDHDWISSDGSTCRDYAERSACTVDGSYGVGWHSGLGHFEDYAVDGIDARQACCVCGGGDADQTEVAARREAIRRGAVLRHTAFVASRQPSIEDPFVMGR